VFYRIHAERIGGEVQDAKRVPDEEVAAELQKLSDHMANSMEEPYRGLRPQRLMKIPGTNAYVKADHVVMVGTIANGFSIRLRGGEFVSWPSENGPEIAEKIAAAINAAL
jgi:hypothetical protein